MMIIDHYQNIIEFYFSALVLTEQLIFMLTAQIFPRSLANFYRQ